MKTALALAVAVAVAVALFIRALVYAVVDAVHLLADRKKKAVSVNHDPVIAANTVGLAAAARGATQREGCESIQKARNWPREVRDAARSGAEVTKLGRKPSQNE
jgi:hypothetical protein